MSDNTGASTEYLIHPLLAQRASSKLFAERDVSPQTLGTLLEAARWAPSSRNEQPWRVLVIRRSDREAHAAMLDVLSENNRQWAGSAPLLLMGVAARLSAHNGRPNAYAWYDTGQAIAHLTFQACASGLVMRQMGGFDKEKARHTFNIPDDFDPVVTLALGYPPEEEPRPFSEGAPTTPPRSRRPLAASVFVGAWGNPADL